MIHFAKIKIDSIENLVDYLQQRKFNIKINEIINAIQAFSRNNNGLFDDIEIYQQKTHSNYIFVDTKFPNNKFAGINAHNVGNKGGVFPAAVSQLIRFLKMAYILRVGSEVLDEQIEDEEPPKFRKVEAKRSKMHPGGLKDWVENEKWVDVRRPKKNGGYEPCGRNDTSKGSKPVCVPSNKAKSLDKKELENRKRQKAKKEKESNPGKKPNTTTYTEEAGGKSNVSNNNNIRFIGSMIPLSELRPIEPRFVKIALMGEEDEIPSTDISNLFSESDKEVDEVVDKVIKSATRILGNIFEGGLTGPGDVGSTKSSSLSNFLSEFKNADVSQMDEKSYLRFVKITGQIKRIIYKQAVDNNDSRMHEIAHKMLLNGTNPFSSSDIAEIVREVVNK
jgi:hypothetical protein